MVEEQYRAQDMGRITSKGISQQGSNNSKERAYEYQGQKRAQSFEEQMLQFMGDNKKLINLHELKFNELENFKSNIYMFQANTGASLKNLETQVGQLALNMQNKNKGAFPSDTQKNQRIAWKFN